MEIGTKKGFTLIELLVAVLIIGILAAIAIPQYETAVERSRMTEAVTTVRALISAADRYFLAMGKAPTNINQLDITLPDNTTKYFVYGISTDSAGTGKREAYAYRIPAGKTYYVYINSEAPSKISCWMGPAYTPNDTQRKLCNELKNQNTL